MSRDGQDRLFLSCIYHLFQYPVSFLVLYPWLNLSSVFHAFIVTCHMEGAVISSVVYTVITAW